MKVRERKQMKEDQGETYKYRDPRASQEARVVKNPPANAGDIRDAGSIPGWGRSPGGGRGRPLQFPCLQNPMDSARTLLHQRSLAGYSS